MEQSDLYTLYDRDPAPIITFLEYVRDLYHLPRPGTVLDMGCGPGRTLAPLAASDWTVVGYEPDPDYAVAARRTIHALPDARFREAGLLDLDEQDAFDLIAAINGPYSYVLELEQRREALRRCAAALRPEGVLFLEFSNFHWVLKNYSEPPSEDLQVGHVRVTRTAHHVIDFYRGTFTHHDRFTWRDEAGQENEVKKVHPMAIVAYPELAFLFRELGFRDVHTFNSYADREPSELSGGRVLVTARAPEGRRG